MEKIHGNMHIFVLTCYKSTRKHKNMHVSMYFLHLVLTFTPHYIITDKGLLQTCNHLFKAFLPQSCYLSICVFEIKEFEWSLLRLFMYINLGESLTATCVEHLQRTSRIIITDGV